MFSRKGLFVIEKESGATEDLLTDIILDAGGEDLADVGDAFEIYTDPSAFEAVENALNTAKVKITSSEITMIPENEIALTGEDAEKIEKLIDALDELDDVQEVYTNIAQ